MRQWLSPLQLAFPAAMIWLHSQKQLNIVHCVETRQHSKVKHTRSLTNFEKQDVILSGEQSIAR